MCFTSNENFMFLWRKKTLLVVNTYNFQHKSSHEIIFIDSVHKISIFHKNEIKCVQIMVLELILMWRTPHPIVQNYFLFPWSGLYLETQDTTNCIILGSFHWFWRWKLKENNFWLLLEIAISIFFSIDRFSIYWFLI